MQYRCNFIEFNDPGGSNMLVMARLDPAIHVFVA